jgi:hypothetical protein
LSCNQCVALEVLSVGDQDQDFIAAGTTAQRLLGQVNGAGDIGAAARDGVDVDGVQGFVKRAVVVGFWEDQYCVVV